MVLPWKHSLSKFVHLSHYFILIYSLAPHCICVCLLCLLNVTLPHFFSFNVINEYASNCHFGVCIVSIFHNDHK